MLATDAVYRDSCVERVRRQMEHGPVFLEARATCRAFGELMELAFDELRVGGADFIPVQFVPARRALSRYRSAGFRVRRRRHG